ncbi:MAG: hypothetical protein ACREEB_18535 [Caulobacteraceae bacterium]
MPEDDRIWIQLEELDRRFADIHKPPPDKRETGHLFIQALQSLREDIGAIRALARSRGA